MKLSKVLNYAPMVKDMVLPEIYVDFGGLYKGNVNFGENSSRL